MSFLGWRHSTVHECVYGCVYCRRLFPSWRHVSQSLHVGTTSQVNCTKIAKIQLGRPGAASCADDRGCLMCRWQVDDSIIVCQTHMTEDSCMESPARVSLLESPARVSPLESPARVSLLESPARVEGTKHTYMVKQVHNLTDNVYIYSINSEL